MTDTLILADDLSGAADCASACLNGGTPPLVLIDPQGDHSDARAVAIDINSRALAPCEAGIAMAGAVTRFLRADTRLLYQKMDSTLRGNWATETASALRAASALANQQMFAIVAPAFPAAGRTVVGGRGMLNGVALEKTETWAWEALTRSAQPAAWLAAEGLRVVLASIEEVRLGPDHLAAFAEHSTVADAIVCDAETEGDLGSIAGAALALTRMPLCVGSAGLMRALARMRAPSPAASAPQGSIATAGPVVILVGSASQVSQAQVRRLAEERPVSAIMIAPSALRGGPASNLMLAYAERIDTVLTSGEDIAVAVDSGQGTDLKDGQQLTRALAELVAPRLHRVGGLIATGGETARAVLTQSGVSGLRVRSEVEPGIPLSSALGSVNIPVVTKAGAFGDGRTLIRCLDAIHGRSPSA
jgi:D-threonate/D-erythronate kinase